ncbi:GNAT family N-acetyltransferase [Amycolatopsis thermophila]|uniref:Ribosomal protein S18 acetylase RimI-like enzyme n=1 Tax=Amycolatopsis thermophila TaxID=206084 RepID=A0ABU0EQM9_9PSEU|nr:GNAT family N-acetyltransferase [Amycolatopsis thermophila]MDQ0377290.1 ribosomal protein S18 acetylase RimI-like enzyme [Amycolatopsis thermophila]
MDAFETLELRCADAWPAVSTDKIGDWRLRAAGGFTGRANSALAVGDPGSPTGSALRGVCDFAHAHRIPPVVQVVAGSETERAIAAAGWVPNSGHAAGHVVSVLTGPLGEGADEVPVLASPTGGWWELTVGRPEPTDAERHVLTTGEIGYALADVMGVTAGAVRAAVVDDVLHIARLAVRPGYRRRGLASALMAACGPWAAERGATRTVLQVAVENAGALAFYDRLGFTEHHRYRYWVPGPGACEDRSL